jgi:hypothetical protein
MASTIKTTNINTPDGSGSITFDRPIITASGVGAGKIVQVVNSTTSAVATGTVVHPADDTITQNDEGSEFLTLAITPTHASNKLFIQVLLSIAVTGAFETGISLFQDSTAGALATLSNMRTSNNTQNMINLNHYMAAGTTSETTFKVRAGGNGSGTWTLNGTSGSRRHGGVAASSITITEISV